MSIYLSHCSPVVCIVTVGAGMEVVSLEAAQQMRAAGQFLVHQEVLGHIYGIPSAAVRKLQALGKLPLLDLDRVQDVEQLRAAGFQVRSIRDTPPSNSCKPRGSWLACTVMLLVPPVVQSCVAQRQTLH